MSVKDWGKTAVLTIFAGQSLRPELSDQKKNELRFNDLQRRLDEVKKDLTALTRAAAGAPLPSGCRRR